MSMVADAQSGVIKPGVVVVMEEAGCLENAECIGGCDRNDQIVIVIRGDDGCETDPFQHLTRALSHSMAWWESDVKQVKQEERGEIEDEGGESDHDVGPTPEETLMRLPNVAVFMPTYGHVEAFWEGAFVRGKLCDSEESSSRLPTSLRLLLRQVCEEIEPQIRQRRREFESLATICLLVAVAITVMVAVGG